MNSAIKNLYNCECGGLRHICAKHGHLPEAIEHYRDRRAPKPELTVVWSGSRGSDELLPDRAERVDTRLAAMPTFDLDDGEVAPRGPSRPYNKTGKYVGICSRTDPNAPQYKPWPKRIAAGDSGAMKSHEESTNGRDEDIGSAGQAGHSCREAGGQSESAADRSD